MIGGSELFFSSSFSPLLRQGTGRRLYGQHAGPNTWISALVPWMQIAGPRSRACPGRGLISALWWRWRGLVEEDGRHLVSADAGFGGHDDAFDGGWWVALRVGGEGVVQGLEEPSEAVDAQLEEAADGEVGVDPRLVGLKWCSGGWPMERSAPTRRTWPRSPEVMWWRTAITSGKKRR